MDKYLEVLQSKTQEWSLNAKPMAAGVLTNLAPRKCYHLETLFPSNVQRVATNRT